jgi:hypothetical protein
MLAELVREGYSRMCNPPFHPWDESNSASSPRRFGVEPLPAVPVPLDESARRIRVPADLPELIGCIQRHW